MYLWNKFPPLCARRGVDGIFGDESHPLGRCRGIFQDKLPYLWARGRGII